ncbi:secretin receptor-like isoform X2 [Saccostrea echinata]|uniref:secretin receptor-like isoform X2 n=1 Tax=Saccostrea echinata TaxID=191078 RepID=UPI002A7FCC4B|nr:secretin receptor-like isoform X2 [Saccostrea echinata]
MDKKWGSSRVFTFLPNTSRKKYEQMEKMDIANNSCRNMIKSYNISSNGLYCEPIWDQIMCWEATLAGTVARKHCPSYIEGLNTDGFAKRQCLENGTWYIPPRRNVSWTDFSDCVKNKKDIYSNDLLDHLSRIRLMYNIGYGVSLCSLVIAVFIMLCCRKLSSKSNTLHINLFIAFILRAFMSFLKETLFLDGLGLKKDLEEVSGVLRFRDGDTHWECKLLFTLFVYTISACAMWIFMEALYLYMMVYKTMFTEKHGVQLYVVFGWLGPLSFVVPWVIIRAKLEDFFCWNTNPSPEYLWILRGPLFAIYIINFIFFLDIVKVLFIRVQKNQRVSGARKVRKMAKFIVVLIPLFGVCYIVFSFLSGNDIDVDRDIPYLYVEMFYNSFQGFILAVLFCFLNEEVLHEIRKAWYKYALRHRESYVYSRSAIMKWRKGSRHSYTVSSFIEKDKSSDFLNTSRLLPKGKNNNDCVSRSFPDFRPSDSNGGRWSLTNAEGLRRETCEEANCLFLSVPIDKHRQDRRPRCENPVEFDLN